MSKVVHCKRDDYDVYIGRANKGLAESKWHNPIVLENEDDREEVLKLYKIYLKGKPELLNDLHELTGKDLGCWCAPRACHGDVLHRWANFPEGVAKIIIAGSRTFRDDWESNYDIVKDRVDHLLKDYDDAIIIHGDARGPDTLGKRYAKEKGYDEIPMRALWDKHGKSAGYRRNVNMARIATMSAIFWDGMSKGSKHMFDISNKHKLQTNLTLVSTC